MQAVTAVMMALRDTDETSCPATTATLTEPQRQKHGRQALERPLFNWNAQDRFIELLNIELEVMNILERNTYDLTDEEKVPVIKSWLGREGMWLIKTFTKEEKNRQDCKWTIFTMKSKIQAMLF